MTNQKEKLKRTIGIVGGGVIGITTGLALQLAGYETVLYCEKRADQLRQLGTLDPTFASLYASGSVIPHSTKIDEQAKILSVSVACFSHLARAGLTGLRFQRHYELWEQQVPLPEYLSNLQNVVILPENGEGFSHAPRLKKATNIYGWYFDCLFSEATPYLSEIFNLYELFGGTTVQLKVSNQLLPPHEVIINCSGFGTRELFDDPSPTSLARGILVYVNTPTPPLSKFDNHLFSYNYVPGKDTYQRADGSAADVYSYPRSDALVLGGTRDRGDIDKSTGEWIGEESPNDKVRISGIDVPRPILEVNRELLLKTTEIDISDYETRAVYGYRFIREAGVRLESTQVSDRLIVHNYAHGGAGVTLSWGCAAKVLALLKNAGFTSHRPWSSISSVSYKAIQFKQLRELLAQYNENLSSSVSNC